MVWVQSAYRNIRQEAVPAAATCRRFAGLFLEQLPESGLAACLWLGPRVQKCRLGRHWKLVSRVVADAANFLGREAPQYSQAEDETYVLQRLSRGS